MRFCWVRLFPEPEWIRMREYDGRALCKEDAMAAQTPCLYRAEET
jgi:hypothetical protein